jgi:hypothetical protein
MKQGTKVLNQQRQHVVRFFWQAGVVLIVSFTAIATNAQNLINGGFETPDGLYTNAANPSAVTTGAANWVQFANGLRTSTSETGNPLTARTGSFSLKCYGSQSWDGEGAYQVISNGVSAGAAYVLSGYGLITSSDPLTNTSPSSPQPFGLMQIGFRNNSGSLVGASTSKSLYSSDGLDVWLSGVVTAVAPATATQISVYVMELGFGATSSGSIYWDDISVANLNAIPEPSTWSLLVLGAVALLGSRRLCPRKTTRNS